MAVGASLRVKVPAHPSKSQNKLCEGWCSLPLLFVLWLNVELYKFSLDEFDDITVLYWRKSKKWEKRAQKKMKAKWMSRNTKRKQHKIIVLQKEASCEFFLGIFHSLLFGSIQLDVLDIQYINRQTRVTYRYSSSLTKNKRKTLWATFSYYQWQPSCYMSVHLSHTAALTRRIICFLQCTNVTTRGQRWNEPGNKC